MNNADLLYFINQMGYVESPEVYGDIVKLSDPKKSTNTLKKIINQTVFKLMINHRQLVDHWEYTCRFVEDMKYGLIKNNTYLLSVLKDGMFDPRSAHKNSNIRLISDNLKENEYTFIRSFRPHKDKKILIDFVLMINKLPYILIINLDSKDIFAEDIFNYIIDNGDKYKSFFNFCKYIILIKDEKAYLGNFYCFFEDCIEFDINNIENSTGQHQIDSYICIDSITKDLLSGEDVIHSLRKEMEQKSSVLTIEDKIENLLEGEEFYENFFKSDLSNVLNSPSFAEKKKSLIEVPDYKHNREYLTLYHGSDDIDIKKSKKDLIVRSNLKLVSKVASLYIGATTSAMDIDDLMQAGTIGLLNAIDRFDPAYDNEFSTYAMYWIKQSINREICNSALRIRLPVHRWEEIRKLKNYEDLCTENLGFLDNEWISKHTDMTIEKIIHLQKIRNTYMKEISLDMCIGEENDTTLGSMVVDEEIDVEREIIHQDLVNCVEKILSHFDLRTRGILCKRFGLNGYRPMTLEEIGHEYDVTRERIRQIEAKALKRAKVICEKYEMHAFTEEV